MLIEDMALSNAQTVRNNHVARQLKLHSWSGSRFRMKEAIVNLAVIAVYAPTLDAEGEVKNSF